ncbi:uncharacterized protein LOC144637849 isoform X2 [Oculina patagonica]
MLSFNDVLYFFRCKNVYQVNVTTVENGYGTRCARLCEAFGLQEHALCFETMARSEHSTWKNLRICFIERAFLRGRTDYMVSSAGESIVIDTDRHTMGLSSSTNNRTISSKE